METKMDDERRGWVGGWVGGGARGGLRFTQLH